VAHRGNPGSYYGTRCYGAVMNLEMEWVNTKTGAVEKSEMLRHAGGSRTLASPAYAEDIALRGAVEEEHAASYTLTFGDERMHRKLPTVTVVAKGKRAASYRVKFGDEQCRRSFRRLWPVP